jgi:hypothetical protein
MQRVLPPLIQRLSLNSLRSAEIAVPTLYCPTINSLSESSPPFKTPSPPMLTSPKCRICPQSPRLPYSKVKVGKENGVKKRGTILVILYEYRE